MAVEEDKAPPAPAAPKSPGHLKLVIVAALALFVALVGAQVAVPLINGLIAGHPQTAATGDDETLDEEEPEEAVEVAVAEELLQPQGPALYTALDPPFVVSFDEEDGARYLQLTLQAMARDEKTISAVKQHSPAIRNSVLFMISGYEVNVLSTQAGKEQLRKDLLGTANEILAKNGAPSGIEELYFTSFVIQ